MELETGVVEDFFKNHGTAFVNEHGYYIDLNSIFADQCGYQLEELRGQHTRILNSGKHDIEYYSDIWETLRSGKSWYGLLYNQKKDGSFFWCHNVIMPMVRSGETVYLVIRNCLSEVSDVVDSFESNIMLNREVMLGRISAKICHDLRNSLSVLSLIVDRIDKRYRHNENYCNAELEKSLPVLKKTIGSMNSIINGFLLLSKRSLCDSFCPVNINQVISDAFDSCQSKAYFKGVHFLFDKKIPDIVMGSHQLLVQVFVNLFINALDAFPDSFLEEEERYVRCSIELFEKNIMIRVLDNAKILTENEKNNFFKIFGSSKSKGHGIGLEICKEIIEKHNGMISIDFDLLQTCFLVTIPRFS